jgi:hypothetical protein
MGKVGDAFDGCLSVYAWIWNHVWGTLFLVGGIYLVFWQQKIWYGLVAVAIGVYFYWTKKWTRKTLDAIAGKDPDGAAGSAPQSAATAPATPTPPGSVSQRKTVIKNVFLGVSLLFLVMGARGLARDNEAVIGTYMVVYGSLALASFFVYARVRVDRAAEDDLPALPWGEMIAAVLFAAFRPNTYHVSYTTPGAEAAAAERGTRLAAASTTGPVPPGSLTKRKLIIRNYVLGIGSVVAVYGLDVFRHNTDDILAVLLYGIPAAALFLLGSRVRFDRPAEDAQPAGPWGETIASTLMEALTPSAPPTTQVGSGAQTPAVPSGPPAARTGSPVLRGVSAAASQSTCANAGAAAVARPEASVPIIPAGPRSFPLSRKGVIAIVAVVAVSALGFAAFSSASDGQTDPEVKRLIASSPSDGRDVKPSEPFFVVSTSDGAERAVVLGPIGGADSDRYRVVVTSKIYYSVDDSNSTADAFLAYAQAHPGAYVDVAYNKGGIRSMNIYPNVDQSSSSEPDGGDVGDGASTADSASTASASLRELLSDAPSDGSTVRRSVYWDASGSVAGERIAFSVDDPGQQGRTYALEAGDLTSCYVGNDSASASHLIDQAFGMYHTGIITYTNTDLIEVRVLMTDLSSVDPGTRTALIEAARSADGYPGDYSWLEVQPSQDWVLGALLQTSGDRYLNYYAWHRTGGTWNCTAIGSPTSDYKEASIENAQKAGVPSDLISAMEWVFRPSSQGGD